MAYEHESQLLLDDEKDHNSAQFRGWERRAKRVPVSLMWSLVVITILSMILNVLQAIGHPTSRRTERIHDASYTTPYAGLKEPSKIVEWDQASVYTSSNTTQADLSWDAINHDSGIVAVDRSWALEKNLPLGSPFPWDNDKVLYFVNAHHGLHCLKNIYRSMMEYREGAPQSLSYHHIIHCLDQLRADVICNADDTLRVTTADMRPVTGEGQTRKCRNWDALQQWTLNHPGCFRYGNPNVEDSKESQIPRLRYCPEGSVELDRVREYFGRGSDWKPADDPVWSWFDESPS